MLRLFDWRTQRADSLLLSNMRRNFWKVFDPRITRFLMERPEKRLGIYDDGLRETLESRLRDAGYTGPVGVDAFVYEDEAGELCLRAMSEVNARYTMGRVAVELAKRRPNGKGVRFEIVPKETELAEGAFILNDAGRARRFWAVVSDL